MTEPDTTIVDPAAKTRVVVGSFLLAFAWTLAAATIVALIHVMPGLDKAGAALVIAVGLITAAAATYAVLYGVFGNDPYPDEE